MGKNITKLGRFESLHIEAKMLCMSYKDRRLDGFIPCIPTSPLALRLYKKASSAATVAKRAGYTYASFMLMGLSNGWPIL